MRSTDSPRPEFAGSRRTSSARKERSSEPIGETEAMRDGIDEPEQQLVGAFVEADDALRRLGRKARRHAEASEDGGDEAGAAHARLLSPPSSRNQPVAATPRCSWIATVSTNRHCLVARASVALLPTLVPR